MKEIDDETLKLIFSDRFTEEFWLYQLGVNSEKKDIDNRHANLFIYSFYEVGKTLWKKYESDFRKYICDEEKGEPNFIVKELIEGDIRNLAEKIIAILMATYSIELALAIPIAALILKKGIKDFCAVEKP
jgi:hypothetical protein